MFVAKNELFTVPSGYQISRSVRFRSSATAYLNRTTTASFTSKRIFTFSFWCKRGTLSAAHNLFDRNQSTNLNQFTLGFASDNTFGIAARTSGTSTISLQLVTAAVFRDTSAWYHIMISVDNTQAVLADRGKIYINGVLQTLTTQTATQNVDYHLLTGLTYQISGTALTSTNYFDGYLTEFNFIDGQALTPSSFGEYDTITGVWKPKKYTGTYGTNGFYLNFSDNSASTAAAIGKDYSGNGNNWTPNNISVTAGATYDSMLDVPTPYADGGNGRGNYAVINPNNTNSFTITGGNLNTSVTGGTAKVAVGTIGVSSGKWYWEVVGTSGVNLMIGVANSDVAITSSSWTTANGWAYYLNGDKFNNNTGVAYGSSYTTNDIIGVALDMDTGTLVFYKNNTSQGTAYSTGLSGKTIVPAIFNGSSGNTQAYSINFGQRPFTYTPPSGFLALNTQNLPTPTIANGADYMAATLYTGTGASLSVVNTTGTESFQPDFIWIKSRSNALSHKLVNSVVGVQKALSSDSTAAESSDTGGVTAFNSDGFTIGTTLAYNTSAATYVAWQWNAGGSTVTNTSGSISAQVRANPTAGFSIVTYTGTGANGTIGHGLGAAPKMLIVKSNSTVTSWSVYHSSIGAGNELLLNSTAASAASANSWNSTAPTSSVFSVGTASSTNTSPRTYVAYCFADVAGYSAFGSYTGNGSTDGPFVFTGFRPRFLMVKRTDSTSNWTIHDTSRNSYNVTLNNLFADLSNAEAANANTQNDILSNGFKVRHTAGVYNANGGTYVYMAFAENPFKYSLAR